MMHYLDSLGFIPFYTKCYGQRDWELSSLWNLWNRQRFGDVHLSPLTTTMGEKAASEIPLSSNREGQELFCPRQWLQHTPEGSISVIKPTNKYGAYMPFGNGVRVYMSGCFSGNGRSHYWTVLHTEKV